MTHETSLINTVPRNSTSIGHTRRILVLGVLVFAVSFPAVLKADAPNTDISTPFVQGRIIGEFGFLAPLYHKIKFSKNGTNFDYIDDGGQDNAFFFMRPSAELALAGRHTVIALYQPLNIETAVLLNDDLVVDEQRFPAGTPLDLRYGFDFYRLSYIYDLLGGGSRHELSIGASLQMRNATISFTSADGTMRRATRDVGPVPLIKVRGKMGLGKKAWLGAEIDGIWAPVKYFNGSSSDVEGALIDLSLRAGYKFTRYFDGFVNVRYLAGGAEGTSSDDSGPGDGYNKNWLQFLTVSLGLIWTINS